MASWFSKTKIDPYGAINPEQRAVNAALGPQLTADMGKTAQDYMYEGNISAPIGAGEEDVVSRAARLNAVAGDTYNRLGAYDPAQVNTDFQSQIWDPEFSNFKTNVEPYLAQELPSFGTARANVVSRELTNLQNNLLQKRFDAQQKARETALNALSGGADYFGRAALIQAIPREIKQAGLDREYMNFVTANQNKQNSVNQALQFLGISTGTVQQEPTTFGNVLTAGKSLAEIYASLQGGSQESLKKAGSQSTGGAGGATGGAK